MPRLEIRSVGGRFVWEKIGPILMQRGGVSVDVSDELLEKLTAAREVDEVAQGALLQMYTGKVS